jgi:TolA-binding protein
MDAIDDELREIKREIVESRSLVIKTNNLASGLAADLKSISKKQQSYERRVFYATAAGYAIFVTALLTVMYVAWNARVDASKEQTDRALQQQANAEKRLKKMTDDAEDRQKAETAAASFYDLVRAGRKREVIDHFDDVRKLDLSRAELAFFTDAVESARGDLSSQAYANGLDHERAGRWSEASLAFEESLKLKDDASHSPATKLELARSYRKLGVSSKAIPILTTLSESSPNKDLLDDATMLLAECLIDVQDWEDAKTTLKSFIRRFPESPFINDAKMALADIQLKH